MRKCLRFFFFLPAVARMPNYFLLHPLAPAPGIYRESGFFDQGQLRTHWIARYPDGREALPAVLVHPFSLLLRQPFPNRLDGFFRQLADAKKAESSVQVDLNNLLIAKKGEQPGKAFFIPQQAQPPNGEAFHCRIPGF